MNSKNLMPSDEQLSAFLDAELPEREMEIIRHTIIANPSVCDRIALLAKVDTVVVQTVNAVTSSPMPEGVLQQLEDNNANSGAEVIELSVWRKAKELTVKPLAIAASIAMVAILIWPQAKITPKQVSWSDVSNVLENRLTGDSVITETGHTITAQLSFESKAGQFCRQVGVAGKSEQILYIACRAETGSWRAVADVQTEFEDSNQYATASSDKQLDKTIDELIKLVPLTRAEEYKLIQQRWDYNPDQE